MLILLDESVKKGASMKHKKIDSSNQISEQMPPLPVFQEN
jgi:hypothetical protein